MCTKHRLHAITVFGHGEDKDALWAESLFPRIVTTTYCIVL